MPIYDTPEEPSIAFEKGQVAVIEALTLHSRHE
jgi:hypothetical protein